MAVTENPYRTPRDVLTAADRLRGDAWQEGFEAGGASRQAEVEEARANYRFMVERAADQKLDGYRELGARLAASEERADVLRAQLAEKEAECERLRRICEYAAEVVAAHGRMSERWNPNHVAEFFEKDVKMLRAAASKGEGDG